MDPQSCFAFLVTINEAFGYTHQQTLDSSFCILMAMLREYNFIMNQRNKTGEEGTPEDSEKEWVTVTDFVTGKPKRVEKVKSF